MTRVTIVMAYFNEGHLINRAIASIYSQTVSDWELIIIDDYSIEPASGIIDQSFLDDKRLKLYRNDKNIGAARSRNKAIKLAAGRFISFLDSDDYWYCNKLEEQLNKLRKSDTSFICSGYVIQYNDDLSNVKYEVRPPSSIQMSIVQWMNPVGFLTLMYDTAVNGKVYMPELKMRNDWGMVYNLCKKGHVGLGDPSILACLTIRNESLTSNKFVAILYTYQFSRTIMRFGVCRSLLVTIVQPTIAFVKRKRIK